ncbi:universal stress protein [Rubrobacter marinus]|uniref:Universal stress protein n=2 Tax=Rubrobacter marinus TaxID=2653852 RepID=A0A6G8Q2P4_9ACTN|nr:universal stress protein [Rubrobacter marinus]
MGSVSASVVRHFPGSVLVARGEGGGELPGRILLALDGSEEASAATRTAVEISNATGSELHAVHVLDTNPRLPYPGPGTWQTWEEELAHAKREARTWVDRQAERIEAEGGRIKDAHLRFGEPDGEIVKLAEELGAALVVIGSRGLTGMSRVLLGGVSDSVVRHAHCPVLVVREPERDRKHDLTDARDEARQGASS